MTDESYLRIRKRDAAWACCVVAVGLWCFAVGYLVGSS